ncbi:MAG: SRPBCC domain-containing protein [Candidatus Zixiibacteriota bacterium]|nr:MAG: SRPBCC domain-containing protein [candidate division Zixibacteria bacterium]
MKANEDPIVVEETYHAAIDTVWKAITDVKLMRQWYFDNIPEFKPEVGFETQFNVKSEDRNFLHLWKIIDAEPMKRIAYTWKFEGYPGDSFVVWELSRKNDSTRLRLTCIIKEDFPDDIPEFKRESCVAGWKYFLTERLKEFLSGKA